MIFSSENPARFTEKPWLQSNSAAPIYVDIFKAGFALSLFRQADSLRPGKKRWSSSAPKAPNRLANSWSGNAPFSSLNK
jgi:hypothetical protein